MGQPPAVTREHWANARPAAHTKEVADMTLSVAPVAECVYPTLLVLTRVDISDKTQHRR